ncbi:hypothetical protein ACN3XK_52180 [Actinomadura welshii]
MAITDHQVAVLRAQLSGRPDEYHRLLKQMDNATANQYLSLVTAAFFDAARRRFLKGGEPVEDAEIIDFVTSVRLRLEEPSSMDPHVGETLIKVAIEKLPPEARDEVSGEVSNATKTILLAGLVGDESFNSDQLEDFLATARQLADEVFS